MSFGLVVFTTQKWVEGLSQAMEINNTQYNATNLRGGENTFHIVVVEGG